MTVSRRTSLAVAVTAVLVVCLDQYTKHLVCTSIPLSGRIGLIEGWLDLVHIRNTGIAFGLLQNVGEEYRIAVMIAVAAVALVLVGVLMTQIKKNQTLQTISIALVLGGAVGNPIDRVRFGEVVYFIDAHWRELYHWPAFNVADAAISVGITLILFDEIFF